MAFSIYRFLILLLVFSFANASWWSSSQDGSSGSKKDVDYSSWSPAQLRAWLEAHHITIPTSAALSQSDLQALVAENWDTASIWTYDQYSSAQQAFSDIRDDVFDKWDESQLRQFLLRQGIVAPKGPREHLVLLAKAKYQSYKDAASSFASQASASASTLVYGETPHQMSKSASSLMASATSAMAQATKDAFRALDDTKDYIYSTWSDSQLRSYLEKKGVLKPKEQKTREQLLNMMKDSYAAVTEPIYDSWSDSAMHDWLVAHGFIKSDFEKNRDKLRELMNRYYYDVNDVVWSKWSDSQLKQWLVDHGHIKSDAEVNREKMIRMVALVAPHSLREHFSDANPCRDNYLAARDTFWHAWTDSAIHDWLVEHGYIRTDAQVKRDELIKLANEKFNDYSARTAAYLTWPDARLRAYLRERGLDDEQLLPMTNRPSLLQETRIRWIQAQNRAEALYNKVKEIVNEGAHKAEEKVNRIWSVLTGNWEEARERTAQGYEKATEAGQAGYEKVSQATRVGKEGFEKATYAGQDAFGSASEAMKGQYERAKEAAYNKYEEAAKRAAEGKEWAEEKASEAQDSASSIRETVGETIKQTGQKLKGEL
ncbi:hypothetical protein M378DRAFT_13978 [Amanita muscaria Koide BX008]|uniref:Uncharacterized protein n=1 Tax=Amanita muscaria (strain Koide BX008) TaxID=946122 RepID=A0A0C2WVA6_AMAMK|nr:hypothetical protein M378DRAFT_13978 [Amanita muscaria Koide BX008]